MQIPSFSRYRRNLKKTRIFQPKHTNDSKHIRYSQGVKEYAEKHLFHLSRQIIFVGEEIEIALLKGGPMARKPTQWMKEATALKRQMSDAIKQQQNSKNPSLKAEELKRMCEQIFDYLKYCPVEGKYDKPITFIAGMHEIEDKKLSYSKLLQSEDGLEDQDLELKLASADTSVRPTAGYRERDDKSKSISFPDSYPASIPELSSEHLLTSESVSAGEIIESGQSSHGHDANVAQISQEGSSLPYISEIQIEKRFESEVIEEVDALEYKRQEKMPISMDDPNGGLASSSQAVLEPEMGLLTSEKNLAQLGMQISHGSHAEENKHHGEKGFDVDMVIPISMIGEMSMYVVLRLEILGTSSSQEMVNLNNIFGLDPERDNYLFSAEQKLIKLELDNPGSLRGGQIPLGSPETFQANGALLPEYLIVNRSGRSNEMPTADEWCQAGVANLMEKNFHLLNDEPDCPNLVLLFLQRNNRLTSIPPSFFDHMPALRFLDLSNTRIRTLPISLFKLTKLQVLMLRSCICLDSLPAEVKNLENMEVLDLSSTDLYYLPNEIGQLTRLSHLQLSFYGPDYGSGYAGLPSEMVSPSIISKLQALQALSIVVHPEDQRWINIARDIIQHIGRLKMLSYLQLYFPTVETLNYFVEVSPSWKEKRMRRFKFVVGHNIKRIISRVPDEVELKYDQFDQCLRFINGTEGEVPEMLKRVLKCVTAFYLDHHLEIQNLSVFGISNFKELKFCVLRECPNFQVMMVGEKSSGSHSESAFPNLEHLGIHYLWELEQIWENPVPSGSFKALRYLMVDTCHKLKYIASKSILGCLSNLETLIVEDCESLKSIVKENMMEKSDATLLPRLTELVLRHLPRLVTLGSGLCPSRETISIHHCPKLILSPQQRTKRRKTGSSYNCSNICI